MKLILLFCRHFLLITVKCLSGFPSCLFTLSPQIWMFLEFFNFLSLSALHSPMQERYLLPLNEMCEHTYSFLFTPLCDYSLLLLGYAVLSHTGKIWNEWIRRHKAIFHLCLQLNLMLNFYICVETLNISAHEYVIKQMMEGKLHSAFWSQIWYPLLEVRFRCVSAFVPGDEYATRIKCLAF